MWSIGQDETLGILQMVDSWYFFYVSGANQLTASQQLT